MTCSFRRQSWTTCDFCTSLHSCNSARCISCSASVLPRCSLSLRGFLCRCSLGRCGFFGCCSLGALRDALCCCRRCVVGDALVRCCHLDGPLLAFCLFSQFFWLTLRLFCQNFHSVDVVFASPLSLDFFLASFTLAFFGIFLYFDEFTCIVYWIFVLPCLSVGVLYGDTDLFLRDSIHSLTEYPSNITI